MPNVFVEREFRTEYRKSHESFGAYVRLWRNAGATKAHIHGFNTAA